MSIVRRDGSRRSSSSMGASPLSGNTLGRGIACGLRWRSLVLSHEASAPAYVKKRKTSAASWAPHTWTSRSVEAGKTQRVGTVAVLGKETTRLRPNATRTQAIGQPVIKGAYVAQPLLKILERSKEHDCTNLERLDNSRKRKRVREIAERSRLSWASKN